MSSFEHALEPQQLLLTQMTIEAYFGDADFEKLTAAQDVADTLQQIHPDFAVYYDRQSGERQGAIASVCASQARSRKQILPPQRRLSASLRRDPRGVGHDIIERSSNFAVLQRGREQELIFNEDVVTTRVSVAQRTAIGTIAVAGRTFEFSQPDSVVDVTLQRDGVAMSIRLWPGAGIAHFNEDASPQTHHRQIETITGVLSSLVSAEPGV